MPSLKFSYLAVSSVIWACALSAGVMAAPHKHMALDTPADPAIINKTQIEYWLIKRGELAKDATLQEKEAAINAFINKSTDQRHVHAPLEKKAFSNRQQKMSKLKASAQMAGTFSEQTVNTTVNVLAVLVDFPDLPHDDNRLTSADTSMYYANYSPAHYRGLLFSTTGFTGPDNNPSNLMSAYQYYREASGNTFSFTGNVYNWVTADNNADYYGGNNAEDDDKNVPALVKEAVTKTVANLSDTELAQYDIEDPYDLDGDGNIQEPDGIIDHIMLFHSSVGEEAGGGVLGADAIWSHRFFVDSETIGYEIPGRDMKVFGYTVQPIDAALGVCVHEFGHDLGLPDEYDLTYSGDGSPVGSWSLMSGGSWTGDIPGAEPTSFSPYARSYLQRTYQGNWVKELVLPLADLDATGTNITLYEAVDSSSINQISIPLPVDNVAFKAPFAGEYQYYSGEGNEISHDMSFDVSLPSSTDLQLRFMAHWNIEEDYDYMQVTINGNPIAGNHTKAINQYYTQVRHFITGESSNVSGAIGADSWVELQYDLTSYAGQNVKIGFRYITDQAVGDYGMAIDNIQLLNSGSEFYADNAESTSSMVFNGFSKIDNTTPGKSSRYLVQLRSHNGIDSGLASHGYDAGVVLWLENNNYSDNDVSSHPGKGLIGVIDADQNLIGNQSTDVQIRDAAFSLKAQSSYPQDTHLTANSLFDDSLDYSAPAKPQSGMLLTEYGLTMKVSTQANDNSQAMLKFARSGDIDIPTSPLTGAIGTDIDGLTVNVTASIEGGDSQYQYSWDFGDGAISNQQNASHTYTQGGDYTVKLTVVDGQSNTFSDEVQVQVFAMVQASFSLSKNNLTINTTNTSTQGSGGLTYMWNFGDGSTSTAASPSHTYTNAGTYTVSLTVKDSVGQTHTASQSVTVTAPAVTPEPNTDSGSGGGSMGWLVIFALGLIGCQRYLPLSQLVNSRCCTR